MSLKSNFWVGKEVEGRFKGLQTLFIVGDQPIKHILEKLQLCNTNNIIIGHLYFGAGNQSKVKNYNTIRHFINAGYLITYEVILSDLDMVPSDIIKSCHIMICIKNNFIELLKNMDTIKLETPITIYCCSKEQFITTTRNEYNNDQLI